MNRNTRCKRGAIVRRSHNENSEDPARIRGTGRRRARPSVRRADSRAAVGASRHGIAGYRDPAGRDRKRLVTFVEIDRCATDAIYGGYRLPAGQARAEVPRLRQDGRDVRRRTGRSRGACCGARVVEAAGEGVVPGDLREEPAADGRVSRYARRELFDHQWVRVAIGPEEFPGTRVSEGLRRCGEGINFERFVLVKESATARSCAEPAPASAITRHCDSNSDCRRQVRFCDGRGFHSGARTSDASARDLARMVREAMVRAGAGQRPRRCGDRVRRRRSASASGPIAPIRSRGWRRLIVSVACHRADDVERAEAEGADYAVLAPIFSPLSKQDSRVPLGLEL